MSARFVVITLLFLSAPVLADDTDQCMALFQALRSEDDHHPQETLPDVLKTDYTQQQLAEAMELNKRLWEEGADRVELLELSRQLGKSVIGLEAEARRFKHLRRRFKAIRFAFTLFDERHAYPKHLDRLTREMGYLQDARAYNRPEEVRKHAKKLVVLLKAQRFAKVQAEVATPKVTTPDKLYAYLLSEVEFLEQVVQEGVVSSQEYHRIRKVVSRQVSFFATMGTLYPSEYDWQVKRFLSTINGEASDFLDVVQIAATKDPEGYKTARIPLPTYLRERLGTLSAKWRAAIAAMTKVKVQP
jgi:hypothetical protein